MLSNTLKPQRSTQNLINAMHCEAKAIDLLKYDAERVVGMWIVKYVTAPKLVCGTVVEGLMINPLQLWAQCLFTAKCAVIVRKCHLLG